MHEYTIMRRLDDISELYRFIWIKTVYAARVIRVGGGGGGGGGATRPSYIISRKLWTLLCLIII